MHSRGVLPAPAAGRRPVARRVPARVALGATAALLAGAAAANGPWYAGAGAGAARLTPDTDDSPLDLAEDTAGAFGLWFGRDLTDRLAAEASLVALGEAELSNGATIGYRAASAGVLARLVGARDGAGPSLYLRLGLGLVDNESELELEKADAVSVWAAAGVNWAFARRWGARAELASYDGDAQAGFVSLFRRFGASGRSAPIVERDGAGESDRAVASRDAPVAAPAPAPRPVAPVRTPSAPSAPAVPAVPALPSRDPGLAPTPRAGAPTARPVPAEAPVDAPFSGPVPGLEFAPGTATPTAAGRRALERLAAELVAAPGPVIEIRAHADGSLGEAAAQALSRERVVAVARALAGAGVDVSRLRARAFGASRPSADGPDDRIELRVLP